MNPKKPILLLLFSLMLASASGQQGQPPFSFERLHQLQQDFEDLQFGLFTHFALPTYTIEDWSDPEMPPSAFYAPKLDCKQWAKAAKSAHMTYGCLSVKHHNGFCLWDTKTTDYSVMSSPQRRDVVREYCDAFRKAGLKVMFHFSILDTHHKLRRHRITPELVEMTKTQLRELLTGYGEVTAIMFDGWDSPWGRISYEDVSFPEIYSLIKSLQPNCLVIDMNSHKYPREALFYSDIKFYEQGAGQKIDAESNRLPAMACLPMQRTWFWKESMPTDQLRDVREIVEDNLVPYIKAHCSFVLNAAPNRDGLIDDNALEALKQIGKMWKRTETYQVPVCDFPVVGRNLALNRPSDSSWSWDTSLMDLANDDNYSSAWCPQPSVAEPFWEVELDGDQAFNQIVVTEPKAGPMQAYRIEYLHQGKWQTLYEGPAVGTTRVHQHNFPTVSGSRVRITSTRHDGPPAIAELGVYAPLP